MEGNKKIVVYIAAGLGLLILVLRAGSTTYSVWVRYKWEKKTKELQMTLKNV
jgi:hypothetical protein